MCTLARCGEPTCSHCQLKLSLKHWWGSSIENTLMGKLQGELFAHEGKMQGFECGIPGQAKVLMWCKVSHLNSQKHTSYFVWVYSLPQIIPRFCNSPQQLVGVRRCCQVCKAFTFHANKRGGRQYCELNSSYGREVPCPGYGFDMNFKFWNHRSLL